MENKFKVPELDIDGPGSQKWDDSIAGPEDETRIDYEASSLDELNAETNIDATEDFGNGSVTGEDDIDDSGIGSDVDDMVDYQSGQADY